MIMNLISYPSRSVSMHVSYVKMRLQPNATTLQQNQLFCASTSFRRTKKYEFFFFVFFFTFTVGIKQNSKSLHSSAHSMCRYVWSYILPTYQKKDRERLKRDEKKRKKNRKYILFLIFLCGFPLPRKPPFNSPSPIPSFSLMYT